MRKKFCYKEAIGTVAQGPNGWGGTFKILGITVSLDSDFVGPEIVEESMENIVDVLMDGIEL